jgi:hypothetical protein
VSLVLKLDQFVVPGNHGGSGAASSRGLANRPQPEAVIRTQQETPGRRWMGSAETPSVPSAGSSPAISAWFI